MKSIFIAILGALSTLFYALNKSKDRKIQRLNEEAKAQEEKIKTDEFIKNEERKTEVIKSGSSSVSDGELDKLYNDKKWYRD